MLGKRNRSLFMFLTLITVTAFIGAFHVVRVEAAGDIPISALAGTWTASSGTGTAEDEDEIEYGLKLVEGVGSVTFSDLVENDGGEGWKLKVNGGFHWAVYDGDDNYLDTVEMVTNGPLDGVVDETGGKYKVQISSIGWQAVINLTSDSSGDVEEEKGIFFDHNEDPVNYVATYKISKQASGGGGESGGGGGGCNTGSGFGFFLMLGALAAFKRTRNNKA